MIEVEALRPIMEALERYVGPWSPDIQALRKIVEDEEDEQIGAKVHPDWCAHTYPHRGRNCSVIHLRTCPCKGATS